jgi:hypothetical protein
MDRACPVVSGRGDGGLVTTRGGLAILLVVLVAACLLAGPSDPRAEVASATSGAAANRGAGAPALSPRGPIEIGSGWHGFVFDGVESQPYCTDAVPACIPPPWTFASGGAGSVLRVVDGFLAGDMFDVYDGDTYLGSTSTVPTGPQCSSDPDACFADPSMSSGVFDLGPGSHAVTIVVSASPFGTGLAFVRVDHLPCGPLDVVFVIDDTGSMTETLANVTAGLGEIIREIEVASVGDFRLGLVTFKDTVTVLDDLGVGTVESIRTHLGALVAEGGMGTPEASDEALRTVVRGLAASDRPPGAQRGDCTGKFRPARRRSWCW